MSSKIYFNEGENKLSRYVVRALSETYRFVSPNGAKRHLRRLLLTPQKRKPADVPESITNNTIATEHGDLMCYSIGSGPTVLFIHGWSGSGAQFFALMKTVAEMGYRAVTYDHYKHGLSGGAENNYPLFIKSIKLLAGKLYDEATLACIVSHSMGSTVSVDVFKNSEVPHFLIAPLFDFYDELKTRVIKVGVSPAFFEEIVASIEKEYEMSVRDSNPMHDIACINSSIAIIHSKEDRFALHSYSEEAAKNNSNIDLQTIHDIGHMRIVSAPETKTALVKFINTL